MSDTSELWLEDYETPDIREQAATLYEQLKPFYLQVHAYVRRKLREEYGEEIVPARGPIPAHLLGKHPFWMVSSPYIYILFNYLGPIMHGIYVLIFYRLVLNFSCL